jgi:hypothetical protein
MKIKLDENLPLPLATLLNKLGHDVHTLHDEMLLGRADTESCYARDLCPRLVTTLRNQSCFSTVHSNPPHKKTMLPLTNLYIIVLYLYSYKSRETAGALLLHFFFGPKSEIS